MTSRTTLSAIAALALVAHAPLLAQRTGRTVVLEADHVIVAPDTVLSGARARVAMRQGKIAAVGDEIPAAMLDEAQRVRLPGAWIVAGFVNAHDHLSLGGDLAETIDAYTPELRCADAFDPLDEALVRSTRGGVTSIGLAPLSSNTFGGIAAVVRGGGRDGVEGSVIEDASYLKLAVVPESLDQNRYPTSRMGAAEMIRARLDEARNPLALATPDIAVLRDVLSGARRVAVHARTRAEIECVLEVCEEFELRPVLIGADDADECIERIRAAGASIALGALPWDGKRKLLELPAGLARSGVPFSFTGERPDDLRRSMALAVRHGLDPTLAIAAVTRVPAEQCGVADRVGSLRTGHDADMAVFSGHPADLTSRLVAVFVGGERIDDGRATPGTASADKEPAR